MSAADENPAQNYIEIIERIDQERVLREQQEQETNNDDEQIWYIDEQVSRFSANEAHLVNLREDLSVINDESVLKALSKLIAELAKNESLREKFTQMKFLKNLCDRLAPNGDAVRIQLCRAIGNICFYNDEARNQLLDSVGLQPIMSLLDYLGAQDIEKVDEQLALVALGCVHNIMNENDRLKEAFCRENLIERLYKMTKYLARHNVNIVKYFFNCLENALESDVTKTQFSELRFAKDIYANLDAEILIALDDYYEEFFNHLDNINNIKSSKEALCETQFIDLVISILEDSSERYDAELARKCGFFLTSLLVTEGDDIELILAYKDRMIERKALEWLTISNEGPNSNAERLYIAASVILANYMRSDKDVEALMNHASRPHERLISLIRRYTQYEGEQPSLDRVNLVHSLLGALRNMCIATGVRGNLIEVGAIDVAAPYITWPNLEVNFKSLAIVRLLVRHVKNESYMNTICTDDTLKAICSFATRCEHVGNKNESARLVAYFCLTSAKFLSLGLFKKLADFGAIYVLVELVKCEHVIMINEALLSLNVFASFAYGDCKARLIELNLVDALISVLERKTPQLPVEMQMNAFKLITHLIEKGDFLSDDKLDALEASLKKMLTQAPNDVIRAYLSKILQVIDKLN